MCNGSMGRLTSPVLNTNVNLAHERVEANYQPDLQGNIKENNIVNHPTSEVNEVLKQNKTWSSVSNSNLSKTFALGSSESLKFRSSVLSLQRSFPLKFIWGKKIFCVWKNVGSEKIFGPKKFCIWKIFSVWKILSPKNFLDGKNIWSKNNFESKKIFCPKFFSCSSCEIRHSDP